MTEDAVIIRKCKADEGKVFDWAVPHYHTEEIDGQEVQVQDHLYAKQLFLGNNDSIDSYIEVDEPQENN